MGRLSINSILGFLNREKRSASETLPPERGGNSPLLRTTHSGESVNVNNSLGVSAVYSCVSKIAETLAAMPLNLYAVEQSSRTLAKGHDAHTLINHTPNDEQTAFTFFSTWITGALLKGRSAALIVRGETSGRPLELRQLYGTIIKKSVNGRTVYVHDYEGQQTPYLPSQLLICEALQGKSPIRVHMENIGLSLATQKYGARYFGTGGGKSGALMTDHALTTEQYDRVREDWNTTQAASEHSHQVPILERGLKYQRFTVNPDEAQFIATRKFQVEEIARIFGVPLPLIQADGNVTYNNVEHLLTMFATNTLIPWARRIEQEIERKLLRSDEQGEYSAEFDIRSLMRADLKTQSEWIRNLVERGIITINEARVSQGFNPIGTEGDVHLVQVNQIPLSEIEEYGQKLTAKPTQS